MKNCEDQQQVNDEEFIDLTFIFDENLNIHNDTEEHSTVYQHQIPRIFSSTVSAEEINTDNGNAEFSCSICGDKTTYRDFNKHKTCKKHRAAYANQTKKNRKARKLRAKIKKRPVDVKGDAEVKITPKLHAQQELHEKTKVKEIYYLRHGVTLPEQHHLYIVTLSTFMALRCSLSKDNRDFRVSIINSDWHEFGDIVVEFCGNGLINEIQAIQCKQVQSRSSILITTLAAEMGKFSLKTRCDILKKLKKKRKNTYDKAYFKLYTVSSLPVNKDGHSKFIYDEDAIKQWKSNKDKDVWKDKELKIPEYNKMSFLNTTDDPDDIYIFKVVDKNNKEEIEELNKFSMYTNQRKLEHLRLLIKSTMKYKFDNSVDISHDLVKYVREHFNQKQLCKKLSKSNFLLKIVELLLKPYLVLTETVTGTKNLKEWHNVLQHFDLTIITKQFSIIEKINKCFNYILQEKTQFFQETGKLKMEKSKISDPLLASILFDKNEDTIVISLSEAYLALWKAQCTPLVLLVNDENELNLINNVITLLHEEHVALKFIVVSDLKIDTSIFSETLRVFRNFKDLQDERSQIDVNSLKNQIEIKICDIPVSLSDIIRYNTHFLEEISPDVLLNMLLGEYYFEYVDASVNDDVVVEDTMVLNKEHIEAIKKNASYEDDMRHVERLSYVVNVKGNPVHVKIPPVL